MRESFQSQLRRLLLLVPFVMRRPELTVKDICARFDITRRQLADDLRLLFLCGRPGYGPDDLIEAGIVGEHVLIRTADYFSRPLRLTAAEGLLLHTGATALLAAGGGEASLERAVKALEVALGSEVVSRVKVGFQEAGDVGTLRRAIEQRAQVRLTYQSSSKEELTERDVDPWSLFLSASSWYLIGWCHRADDERIFRLDRMRSVELLDKPVERPGEADLSKYEHVYVQGSDSEEVILDVDPAAARWMTDYYPLRSSQESEEGRVEITLAVGGRAWLHRLLLRLGPQARVIEPEDLREEVEALACRMLARYGGAEESD